MKGKVVRLQLGNQLVTLLQRLHSIGDKLIDNGLGRLGLVNNSSDFAHQPRTCVVKNIVVNIVGQILEIMLDRDDTLRSQVLNLLLTVLFPVLNVCVVADTKWSTLLGMISVFLCVEREVEYVNLR